MMTNLPIPRRPLGQIMVDHGLLSSDQLAKVLAEQARTGKPLGNLIVALGLASAGAVGNALAEQRGTPLKTEYGFSAGLQTNPPAPALATPNSVEPVEARAEPQALRIAQPAPVDDRQDQPAAASSLSLRPPTVVTDAEPVQHGAAVVDAAEDLHAQVDEQREKIAELEQMVHDLSRARSEAEDRHRSAAADVSRLVNALADAEREAKERSEHAAAKEEEAEKARAELAALRDETRAGAAELEALRVSLAEGESERERLREKLERLRMLQTEAIKAEEPAPTERHLLWLPAPDGYRLIERVGPAPTAGEEIEVEQASGVGRYRVLASNPAPLPGAKEPCAYLEAL